MTTVIDHAIAIPARQGLVWEQLRDIERNPIWQVHVARVQFLTTKHSGRGVRWRATLQNGQERVFEITAWYEGLGYEYMVVDGTSVANNRGRIRLQESPEGTIVQWFFTYEVTGFLGGLRNSFGLRRQFDGEVIASLRQLYSIVKEQRSGESFTPETSKAYLREAPDVAERSVYQPRYPRLDSEPVVQDADAPYKPPTPIISEPPIAEDDTRPNPSIVTDTQPETVEPVQEAAPISPEPPQETTPVPSESKADEPEFLRDYPTDPAPAKDMTAAAELPPINAEDIHDTSQISVFEIFGLQKPSETGQMKPVQAETPTETQPAPSLAESSPPETSATRATFQSTTPIVPDIHPDEPRRRGLRAVLRSRSKNLRKPK